MMPKSSAPRLSRFAGMPLKCMQTNANRRDKRNRDGSQQRRARASQEQKQHENDDDESFDQRVDDGMRVCC